jgi:hypothetical protein
MTGRATTCHMTGSEHTQGEFRRLLGGSKKRVTNSAASTNKGFLEWNPDAPPAPAGATIERSTPAPILLADLLQEYKVSRRGERPQHVFSSARS